MQLPQPPTGVTVQEWQAKRDEAFAGIVADVGRLLTDKYVAAFRSRAVMMIPTIRHNAEVFAVAASGIIGSRRLGNLVGTLLAGAYSLVEDGVITPEEAAELLKDRDFTQQKDNKEVNDEQELIDHIMQTTIKVPVTHGTVERTAARLTEVSQGEQDEVSSKDATDALALIGIKAMSDGVVIANKHKGIKKLVEGTHWSKDWGRVLRRIQGATLSGVVRIGSIACRGVLVPWRAVLR